MKEEIQRLKSLQEVDLEIGRIELKIAAGNAELEGRQELIDKYKGEIEESTVRLEEGEARRKQLEVETEETQAMIKERQGKLMKVQTNREYQSILKEIEDAKNANRQRDDEMIRLLEQAEFLEKKKEEQVALCEEEGSEYEKDSERISQESAELDAKREKVLKTRNTRVKKVRAALLRKYEQIREKRDGVAMVGVTKGVCLGCYMNVPPQLYNELLREDKLHSCPTCNRLLYNAPESD